MSCMTILLVFISGLGSCMTEMSSNSQNRGNPKLCQNKLEITCNWDMMGSEDYLCDPDYTRMESNDICDGGDFIDCRIDQNDLHHDFDIHFIDSHNVTTECSFHREGGALEIFCPVDEIPSVIVCREDDASWQRLGICTSRDWTSCSRGTTQQHASTTKPIAIVTETTDSVTKSTTTKRLKTTDSATKTTKTDGEQSTNGNRSQRQPSDEVNTRSLVGGLVGGVLGVVVVIALIVFICWRLRNRRSTSTGIVSKDVACTPQKPSAPSYPAISKSSKSHQLVSPNTYTSIKDSAVSQGHPKHKGAHPGTYNHLGHEVQSQSGATYNKLWDAKRGEVSKGRWDNVSVKPTAVDPYDKARRPREGNPDDTRSGTASDAASQHEYATLDEI